MELEGLIRTAMRKQGIEGMSVVVLSGGRKILASGHGLADLALRVPITIDLDAPAAEYVPEVSRSDATGPTVRRLLTHHSGLQDNIMEGFELKEPDRAFAYCIVLVGVQPRVLEIFALLGLENCIPREERLRVPRAGRFRCIACRTVLAIDHAGGAAAA